jgi:putative toxin-antitoxin system antitoxin component (TIGR02293 family)
MQYFGTEVMCMTQKFTPTRKAPPLPGTTLLGVRARTLIALGQEIDQGFSTSAVAEFSRHLSLTLEETLGLLRVSDSTYHSHKRQQKPLRPETSAHLYQLARVTEAAEDYFEHKDAAHAWLQTPRATFGGQTPLQFARLPGGAEYVSHVLGRMEHGIPT